MKVLITGGTGYVGSHTLAAVTRQGHKVRLLARNVARVRPALEPLGVDADTVETVVGDVTDPAVVAAAVDGADAVIHLASVFSMDSRDVRRMRRVNVPGTELVLAEARRAGADPIIYPSSYAALLPAAKPLNTDLPPGPRRWGVPPYFTAQSEAEELARRHQAEGAPVVTVNLLAVLGPHDPHVGDQLTRVRNALLGRLKFPPEGGFSVNDVRDVAALLAAALTPGMGPRRFIPAGHYVSTRTYIATMEEVTGRRIRVIHPPARGALVLCRMVDVVQHVVPWHIPAEYTAAYMCYCDAQIDPSLPAEPLGVGTRPFSEIIADSISWLHDQGLITAEQAGRAASRPAVLA